VIYLKNSKGFSLIEAIITSAIMAIVSLAVGQVFLSQLQANTFLEDQLIKVQLTREVEMVAANSDACMKTFDTVNLLAPGSSMPLVSFKDSMDNPLVSSSQDYEKLHIGQMTLLNESVPSTGGTGSVKVVIPISRTRKGGGPSVFKPLEVRMMVTANAAGDITNCGAASTTKGIYVMTANGSFTVPANVSSIEVELWGGGGGGGAGGDEHRRGGGGGAGAYVRGVLSVTPGQVINGVVGAGGAGGVGCGGVGASGGSTQFSILTANGGIGGSGHAVNGPNFHTVAGTGGAEWSVPSGLTNLFEVISGENGTDGKECEGGEAGASPKGGGRGKAPGGGGGGGSCSLPCGSTAGLNGQPGRIVIQY
jgi:prepilin-type N-terminal cleavage/methylation domain-containing protein